MTNSPKVVVEKAFAVASRLVLAGAIGAACLSAAPALAGNTTYQYDALGRVVKVTYPDTKQVCYYYDAAGNRYLVQHQATGTCTPTAITLTTSSSLVATTSTDEVAISQDSSTDAVAGDAVTEDTAASSSDDSAATN